MAHLVKKKHNAAKKTVPTTASEQNSARRQRTRCKLCRRVQRALISLAIPFFTKKIDFFRHTARKASNQIQMRWRTKECRGPKMRHIYREIGSGTKRQFSLTRCKFPDDVVAQLNNVLRSHNILAPDAAFVNLDEAPRFREGEQIGRRLLRVAGQRFCVILPVQIEEGVAEQKGAVWWPRHCRLAVKHKEKKLLLYPL